MNQLIRKIRTNLMMMNKAQLAMLKTLKFSSSLSVLTLMPKCSTTFSPNMVLCQNANSLRPEVVQEESHLSNTKKHQMLPKLLKVRMVPTMLEELLLLNTVARRTELLLPPLHLEKSPACSLEILDSTQPKNLLEDFSLMQEKSLPLELL